MAMSTGKVVALIQAMGGGADPAVIEAAVQDWLDAHPEATTTVQDGSITEQKLATSIAQKLGLISSLSDEIVDVKSATNELYNKGSITLSSFTGHTYIENYPITSSKSYTVYNNTNKSCALRTSNTKVPDTVQSITDNLRAGNSITFTANANANYLRAYFDTAATGTLVIVDDTSIIVDIQGDIKSLENATQNLLMLENHMQELYNKIEVTVTGKPVGYLTLWSGVSAGNKFTIKNNTDSTLAFITKDANNNTIENLSSGLPSGNTINVVISQNAAFIKTYLANNSITGTIDIIDKNSVVPKLQDAVTDLASETTKNTNDIYDILHPINNVSDLWENGGFNYSGIKNADADKCRSIDFIDESITSVLLRDTSYSMYVFGWDSTGACVGYWYDTQWNQDTSLSFRSQTSFAFDMFRSAYPGYKFKLVLHKTGISIANIDDAISFTHRAPALGEYRQRPMLTFIDDDGYAQSAAIWEDIVNTCNVPVTMALITANVGVADYAVNWDDVARLKNIGFEFVSHTHEHIFLGDASLTENEVIADFKNTIEALASHGCESKFLVYPYTTITSENEALVRKYFSLGISLQNQLNAPYISKTMVHRYDINSGTGEKTIDGETVIVHLFRDFENMKSIIDDAVLHNGWIVFMSHLRNTYRGDQYYYDANVKQLIVDTVAYARSRNVEITTVSNAYAVYRNVIK